MPFALVVSISSDRLVFGIIETVVSEVDLHSTPTFVPVAWPLLGVDLFDKGVDAGFTIVVVDLEVTSITFECVCVLFEGVGMGGQHGFI